uniref:Stress-response A/B barrel domain-containing protein n=1 Tax=Triticum urartu TaxID=4572 RepID=A0A8R7VEV9_TRIUA
MVVPRVSYLHAGPILRLCSPAADALGLTHLLHSRYATKANLVAYAAHPAHVAAVQVHIISKALDTTTVDWVNTAESPSTVGAGVAVRLTLARVNDGVEVRHVVEKVAKASKDAGVARVSFAENFSSARDKGYGFMMVAVFDNMEELDAVEGGSNVEEAKAALSPMLDEVMVLDFVV